MEGWQIAVDHDTIRSPPPSQFTVHPRTDTSYILSKQYTQNFFRECNGPQTIAVEAFISGHSEYSHMHMRLALSILSDTHQSRLKRSVLPLLPCFILCFVAFDTLYLPNDTTPGPFKGTPTRLCMFLWHCLRCLWKEFPEGNVF